MLCLISSLSLLHCIISQMQNKAFNKSHFRLKAKSIPNNDCMGYFSIATQKNLVRFQHPDRLAEMVTNGCSGGIRLLLCKVHAGVRHECHLSIFASPRTADNPQTDICSLFPCPRSQHNALSLFPGHCKTRSSTASATCCSMTLSCYFQKQTTLAIYMEHMTTPLGCKIAP